VPRPEQPLARIAGAVGLAVGWFVVAHEGGSGWVQLLGDVLWGTLLVGLAGPGVACARARARVVSSPTDATAGLPVILAVSAGTRMRLRPIDPPGPVTFLGRDRGATEELTVVPERRGVHQELVAELASAAPFGMLWWRRQVRLPLAGELVVGPRLGPARPQEPTPEDRWGTAPVLVPAAVGDARGVRDYRAGDQRRWVHWAATAHRGELVVREMESQAAEPVVVEALLPADPEGSEREAEVVLGTVVSLLGAGREVVLVTTEAAGRRQAPVTSRADAGRRLARAVASGVTPAVASGVKPGAASGVTPGAPGALVLPAESQAPPAGPRVELGQRRSLPALLLERVREANRPPPPVDSVGLRLACAVAVLIGLAAVRSQGEVSTAVATLGAGAVVAGMLLSYRLRAAPPMWLKPVLAVASIAAFVWFFHQLSGQPLYDVSTVEDPLASLFVAMIAIHSFDVPARRDLSFTLAGSAALMAVAASQATDMSFGLYALAWMAVGFWALLAMWASASGGGRVRARTAGASLAATALPALAALLVLPAPAVGGQFDFPIAPGGGGALAIPFGLAGDAGAASEPARPGSTAGRSRVGGFTGFATRLDTALRGTLGSTEVMRVRAQFPSYWVGETFDRWGGESWAASITTPTKLAGGSPFIVPSTAEQARSGAADLQTFYMVSSTPNLVLHAEDAQKVWFPTHDIFLRDDGTIVSPIGLGAGAIYTVRSVISTPSPNELRAAGTGSPTAGLDTKLARRYLELPYAYPRAAALAAQVTAGTTNTYDKVEELVSWIGLHTRYSTDIPPLPSGADTVNEFLFGDRVGFCEQISTALAVMLRTLGIPAREAVGYVPGPYNPITDLYDVQARDAHAWVQVWFPGDGWQSFDPTAVVPLANPSPGGTLLGQAGNVLSTTPVIALGAAALALSAGWLVVDLRRRRPKTPALAAARRMERVGARAGRPRRPAETLAEYAGTLECLEQAPPGAWRRLASTVEAAAYGDPRTAHAAEAALRGQTAWDPEPSGSNSSESELMQ